MLPPLQLIAYGTLAIFALYLAYVVSNTVVLLFWYLIQALFYGTLLAVIVWFLYKNGFFDFLKNLKK
ncbi:MAG: hypothetical protein DRR19_12515 [Candidatus Parabeggiatoa sp. nov. 1]|nr:MAG: hypothetical protein DRR19_12515 [Gammaproteobacteria bacterium]